MKYYLVKEGDVTVVNPCSINCDYDFKDLGATDDNCNEWVIVYAVNEDDALRLAEAYDAGLAQEDNIWCEHCNASHAAVQKTENQQRRI